MGIQKLNRLFDNQVRHGISEISASELRGKVIAVDGPIAMHKCTLPLLSWYNCHLINAGGKITTHIKGMWLMTLNMLSHGIIPVFVFDGPPPVLKTMTIQRRKDERLKSIGKIDKDDTVKLLKAQFKLGISDIDDTLKLLQLMGIPIIIAPEEAEATCANLNRKGIVDGVISDDGDTLVFGAPIMITHFSTDMKKKITVRNLQEILDDLKITMEQFIEICIVLGTDYNDGIEGVRVDTIIDMYKTAGNMERLLETLDKDTRYTIPADFKQKWREIKKYFMQDARVTNIDNRSAVYWAEPNFNGLRDYLIRELDFQEEATMRELNKLRNLYKNYKNPPLTRKIAQWRSTLAS